MEDEPMINDYPLWSGIPDKCEGNMEPEDFETKDSGKRLDYPSGMRRDIQDGKPDYTLVDFPMLTRWAALMTRGAAKYGRCNWTLANSQDELDRFKASAMRHMMQYLSGDRDEDHAAAVIFNLAACEHVRTKLLNQKS